jgi:hypothetical protein
VTLQRSEFPFGGPFVTLGGAHRASGTGHFAFTVASVFTTARWRVVTQTPIAVASPVATATVAVKVGLRVRRGHRRHVRLTGTVWPAVPHGRATLERLSRHGHWLRVGRRHRLSRSGAHYSFTVRRRRSARTYRVIVDPRDGGAHARGTSRYVTLTGRR